MSAFLVSSRVTLRPVGETDIPYLVNWVNDPEIRRYWTDGQVGTLPVGQTQIQAYLQKGIFCIIDSQGPKGIVSLQQLDWINRKAMLEVAIGEKSAWRKGLATEALRLVLHYAFGTLNLHKVWLGLYGENIAAYTLYLKMGFTLEAVLSEDLYREGRFMSRLVMRMLRREWDDSNR